MYLPRERQLMMCSLKYTSKRVLEKKIVKNSHIDQFEQNFHQKKDKDLYYNTL